MRYEHILRAGKVQQHCVSGGYGALPLPLEVTVVGECNDDTRRQAVKVTLRAGTLHRG